MTQPENRTIYCRDNLDVLYGLNSASVDLIYLDPPFNTNKTYTAPIGSSAEGASFDDIFTKNKVNSDWIFDIEEDHPKLHKLLEAVKEIEGGASYNFYYLVYMAVRLVECHRVLKDTGSIYLHCDPTMSHYLKLVMDYIFGEKNFRNEIVWSYRWASNVKTSFAKKHDILLFYTRSGKWHFNMDAVREPYTQAQLKGYKKDEKGYYSMSNGSKYYANPIGQTPGSVFNIGIISRSAKERTGYPTQKPLALLERIIKASSNEGDLVLDPFCGCATTCVAAETLNRRWVGVDVSIQALLQVRKRMNSIQKELTDGESKELTPAERAAIITEIEANFTHDSPTREYAEGEAKIPVYVYLLSDEGRQGEYKIGISINPESRRANLQTGNPDKLKVEHSRIRDDRQSARKLEQAVINIFKPKKDEKDKQEEPKGDIMDYEENKQPEGEWIKANLQTLIDAIEGY